MNLTVNQTCNDLSLIFLFLLILGIGIVVAFLVWRNVSRFQREIRVFGNTLRAESFDDLTIGDDGELVERKSQVTEDGRKKKKRDHAPSVYGCVTQQLLIAVLGLITALISALATTNPVVSIAFQNICSNIVNVGSTSEVTPLSPTPEQDIGTEVPTNPIPSPTTTITVSATPAITPSATNNPTPTISNRIVYHQLNLTDSLNTWSNYLGLSPGEITFDDIPFRVGIELNTYGCRQEITATRVSVAAGIANPIGVYVLVNAGNGFASQSGRNIGQFDFLMDNTTYSYQLILGQNIRDWATSPSSVVTQITSSDVEEVWTGRAYDGRTGRIDLIRIVLPDDLTHQTLRTIEIVDVTSASLSSGTDPCIQVQAITVASRG